MTDKLRIQIDGTERVVTRGESVAAAIINAGEVGFRKSVSHTSRGPLCGMGVCQECRVKINGAEHQRSCMVLCEEGMEIETDV
jgi:sarcosine oxidase subunit alpha